MEIPTVQGFADTHMNAQRQKGPITSYAVQKGSITSYGVQKGSVQVLQTNIEPTYVLTIPVDWMIALTKDNESPVWESDQKAVIKLPVLTTPPPQPIINSSSPYMRSKRIVGNQTQTSCYPRSSSAQLQLIMPILCVFRGRPRSGGSSTPRKE